ncbi:MAG: hypothetical protein S4CHLAM102_08630 [Chlamydiia bacterium]|nr:hypothetical protein [Chlamydiia bacterium]
MRITSSEIELNCTREQAWDALVNTADWPYWKTTAEITLTEPLAKDSVYIDASVVPFLFSTHRVTEFAEKEVFATTRHLFCTSFETTRITLSEVSPTVTKVTATLEMVGPMAIASRYGLLSVKRPILLSMLKNFESTLGKTQ